MSSLVEVVEKLTSQRNPIDKVRRDDVFHWSSAKAEKFVYNGYPAALVFALILALSGFVWQVAAHRANKTAAETTEGYVLERDAEVAHHLRQ